MAQTGLHTLISFNIFKNQNKNNWFLYAFLLGSVLPDLDLIFDFLYKLYNITINQNNFNLEPYLINKIYLSNYDLNIFHSIITIALIYLFILIIFELKKTKSILNFGNGLTIGLLAHVSIDILLFLRPVQIFWPLNIVGIMPYNIWNNTNIPFYVITLYLSLEFLFFRLFASKLIEIILKVKNKDTKYILYLSQWMRIQGLLFILFIIYFNLYEFSYIVFIFYNICLSISIATTIFFIFILRKTINNYFNFNEDEIVEINAIQRATSIDNIG